MTHFGAEVLRTGCYERALTQVIARLLRHGDTFLDIGANEGYFSVFGARCVGRGGRVLAVEPQSRLIPIVRTNFELNALENAAVYHLALGAQAGTLRLELAPEINSGASGFQKRWRFGGTQEDVAVTRLDDFADREFAVNVRLAKIDCEGAEPLILEGAQKFFSEQRTTDQSNY